LSRELTEVLEDAQACESSTSDEDFGDDLCERDYSDEENADD